jgi:4-aminobutyrate aminotransferase/(S)-3-amino-2-methylpropionate transaminase
LSTSRGRDMSAGSDLLAMRRRYVPRSYLSHHDILAVSADGALIVDERGRRYIDFAGGIGVVNVGHRAKPVLAAVQAQIERIIHTGPVVIHEPYIRLAARLSDRVGSNPQRQALFLNSGAEAVETAIKLARHATGRAGVIAFQGGFHGRTFLASALTGKALPYKTQPGSMAPDIFHVPYPDPLRTRGAHSADDVIDRTMRSLDDVLVFQTPQDKVAAVIVEPIQGEGGYVVPPTGFLAKLAQWCRRRDILLVVDEIQTGYGRTGRFFAFEHEDISPDIVTVGKSIADGLPLAAVVATESLWERVYAGDIGGTYGGNPVACAAGLAVLDMFDHMPLLERANEIGLRIQRALSALIDHPRVAEVRGLGAMIAVEFVHDRRSLDPDPAAASFVVERARAGGLIVIKTGVYGNVVRLLPPLIADDATVDEATAILVDVVLNQLPETDTTSPGE